MRAYEFLKENATSGGTSAGSVATVVKPQTTTKKGMTLFGTPAEDFPEYGDTKPVVIRRPGLTAKKK